jgi:arylsulfatase A-like enzyme
MQARVTFPSVTLPCHASLFLASGPDAHAVTTNTWSAPQPPIPSLFEVAHRAGLDTAAFYTWEQLRDLAPPGTLDRTCYWRLGEPEERRTLEVARAAAAYLVLQPPGLCFVYLEATDQAGHRFGWMSDRYLAAVAECDLAIGIVLGAVARAGRLASTAIVVTSDHGGHDRSHGTELPEDMTVPWVLVGPRIPEGRRLVTRPSITDTAPSLSSLLGIEPPAQWRGQVVHEAFLDPTDRACAPPSGSEDTSR